MPLDPILKNNPHIKDSDYALFEDDERKRLIVEYVKHIESLGYKPVKVFGHDMYDIGVSFRALFEFKRPIETKELRKHTAFFEARDFSEFSLKRFKEDVLETTSMSTLEAFDKALKIRIFNSGFTDEEILAAILPHDRSLKISDIYYDEKIHIPNNMYNYLFTDMNLRGGGGTNSRVIKRAPGSGNRAVHQLSNLPDNVRQEMQKRGIQQYGQIQQPNGGQRPNQRPNPYGASLMRR